MSRLLSTRILSAMRSGHRMSMQARRRYTLDESKLAFNKEGGADSMMAVFLGCTAAALGLGFTADWLNRSYLDKRTKNFHIMNWNDFVSTLNSGTVQKLSIDLNTYTVYVKLSDKPGEHYFFIHNFYKDEDLSKFKAKINEAASGVTVPEIVKKEMNP